MEKSLSYNRRLAQLREDKGLTVKEAAKGIGILPYRLFLFERGYFRPRRKTLDKIEAFYGEEIDISGHLAYPTPLPAEKKVDQKSKKRHFLISGIVCIISLFLAIGGLISFTASASNVIPLYGETYSKAREIAFEKGEEGRDLLTDLPYHYIVDKDNTSGTATISFYKTNSLLFYNDCTFSSTTMLMSHSELGIGRFHFSFGGDLSRSSYLCSFSYSSPKAGIVFSCDFLFDGGETTKLEKLDVKLNGLGVDEELALFLINVKLDDAYRSYSKLLTDTLGKEVDFYRDFLPDRESGRKGNFAVQITGLSLFFPNAAAFFLSLAVLLITLIGKMKPGQIYFDEEEHVKGNKKLPKDFDIPFGVPDYLIIWISRVFGFGSIALLLFSYLGKMLFPLPEFFYHESYLNVLRVCFLIAPFLKTFVSFGSTRKEKTLLVGTAKFLLTYAFLATMETALIGVADAWGYDIAGLIYQYVPGNVFLSTTLLNLVFLFLFFIPNSIKKGSYRKKVLWHLLSLLPVGVLVATIIVGSSYQMVYGVKKNIYVLFWFSNSYVCLTAVSLLFLYGTFLLKKLFQRHYGNKGAATFFSGNRYMILSNALCAIMLVIVALIDLQFLGTEYGYYLGIGDNIWILIIIPFVLVCRFAPGSLEASHIDDDSLPGMLL